MDPGAKRGSRAGGSLLCRRGVAGSLCDRGQSTSCLWHEFPHLRGVGTNSAAHSGGNCEHRGREPEISSEQCLARSLRYRRGGCSWGGLVLHGLSASMRLPCLILCHPHIHTCKPSGLSWAQIPSTVLFISSWCPGRTWPGRCRICPVTMA